MKKKKPIRLGQCPISSGVSDVMRAAPVQAAPAPAPVAYQAPAAPVAAAPVTPISYAKVAPPPPPVATPQAQALAITSESSPIEDLLSFGSIAGIVYLTLDLFDLV